MFESNMLENIQQMHYEEENGVYVPPSCFPVNAWEAIKGLQIGLIACNRRNNKGIEWNYSNFNR